MSFEYSSYVLPLIAAAIVSAAVAIYAWMRRSANGALVLFLMAVSLFVWSIGYSIEIAGTGLETKYFGGVIQYVGIAFAPYFWLMFSIVYDGQTKIISRRFIILTVIIPIITLGLALTTKWHGLIWNEYHVNRQNGFSALDVSHGFWFTYVHLPYSYIILLIGVFLLTRVLWRRRGMYRGQIIALLIAVLAPVIGNVLYLTGNSPILYLDLTPFALTVSVAALAWAIFGFHLVDITPLARDRVVDSMREGMIVLDVRGNIVDINNAAARMIGVPAAIALGKTAIDVFSPWSHLVERFRNVMNAKDEISVGQGEAERHYEVRLSPLQDPQGQLVGRVIMLRAMDDEEIPQPRFAAHEPVSRPLVNKTLEMLAVDQGESGNNIWEALKHFFLPPIRYDLPVRADVNPIWERTLERILTVLLRAAAAVGTIAAMLLILPSVLEKVFYALLIILGIVYLWVLGLWRSLPVPIRTGAFLLVVYCLAFSEVFKFGYSAEAFVYFVFIVVFGVLLGGVRGGFWSLAISFVTLSVFGWLITQGIHHPPAVVGGRLYPIDFTGAVISVTAYAASSMVLVVSVNLLMKSLDSAWQKETQALNLLQQERDLLERRVEERTREIIMARQESEARFRQIVENASDIIYRADINGNFTYANPSALKMMGYASEQEMLGRNYLDLTTPEFRHKLKRVYDHQYASKTKSTYYEFPAVTMDGQVVWVGQNVQLIMDGEQVVGFQAVARNITQLKQAQEALSLSRDQALDASRFKSQLLSRVSHELRTPLGGILGYAELLQYKAFGSLSEKQHNAVNNIIESANYLTRIVNDLLDEAQIESKSLSLHNEYFNPVGLLEKIKSTVSALADKKGLAFRVEIDPELPSELYGDTNRLQQVVINLAGNAIKFTKQGEVSVSLKRPAPAHWSIEVRDTGAGISRSEHESIFEPFRQVNNSITRENRGSGLGLAITRQLVELMGGQISLESEIGQGSLFTVTLPIKNAPGE